MNLICYRLGELLDGCGFLFARDIDPAAVLTFVADLRKDRIDAEGNTIAGRSIKTANEYLAAAKGFRRWLRKRIALSLPKDQATEAQTLAATGTDGRREKLGPSLSPQAAKSGDSSDNGG